jgi:PAS domain S-box-containing protein
LPRTFRRDAVGWLLLFAVSALMAWQMVVRADRQMRADLLRQAYLSKQAITVGQIREMSATERDLDHPTYRQIKERLNDSRLSNPECRFLYLLGRRADGVVYFFADSEPDGAKDNSPPGQVYEAASADLRQVFQTKTGTVEGPIPDEWGVWVSALVPVMDPTADAVVAVFGMDVDARAWKWNIVERVALPVGLMLMLLIGLAAVLAASRQADASPEPVLRRLMPPLAIMLGLLLAGGLGLLWLQQRRQLDREIVTRTTAINREFQVDLNNKSVSLDIVLHFIAAEPGFPESLRAGNTAGLQAAWQPLFQQLVNSSDVEYVQFLDAQRKCLLRLRKPQENGDVINRFTTLEAERTGQRTSGLELGPLGTLTFWMVQPVFLNGQRVGFVEIGDEIDEVLQMRRSHEGLELAVTIRKEYENRLAWEAGMRHFGREANWNRLSNSVVTYASQGHLPDSFSAWADPAPGSESNSAEGKGVSIEGRAWQVSGLALRDAAGRDIGTLLFMHDITADKAAFARLLLLGSAGGGVLLAGLLGFVFVLLRRTDASILVREAELQASELQYRFLADNTDDFVTLYDAHWRCLYTSPSYYRRTGWSPNDLQAHDWRTRMHPDDLPVIEQARVELQNGRNKDFEHRIRCRDDSWMWVEVRTKRLSEGSLRFLSSAHDVTRRKQAEQELLQLNQQLEQRVTERTAEALELYHHAPCGYHSLGPDGLVLQMNDTELDWLGYRRDEVEGRLHFAALLTPQSATLFGSRFRHLCATGSSTTTEWDMRRKDGSSLTVLVSSAAVLDAAGRFLKSRSTVNNISERKHLETILQASEAKFRRLVEFAPLPLALLDLQGRVELLNDRFTQVLGYTIADLSSMEVWWENAYPDPEYRRQMLTHWEVASAAAQQRSDGLLEFPDEVRVNCRDGIVRTMLVSGRLMHDQYLVVFHDVTALREATDKLRKLSQAVEFSPSMIMITDLLGRVEYVNPAWEAVTGHCLQEVLGQRPSAIKSGVHSREFYAQVWGEITAGRIWRGEFCNRRKNGELYWESAAIAPVHDEKKQTITHFIAVKEDITAHKQADEQLHAAMKAAEAANRAKSTFLANMSHEIRTPMNAILGFSQLLLRDAVLSGSQQRQVTTIQRSGEHLLNIINDILEMARIESGRGTLNPAPFDLHQLLDELERMFSPRFQAKQLHFIVERGGEVPQSVLADGTKLRQILINLLGNAAKFTPNGGTIVLRVQALRDLDGMWRLQFEVEDTGMGIAAEDIPHLFEAFFQTQSGRQVAGGTGLGLPISREFVRLMSGDIHVSSEVGAGSIFRFDVRVGPTGTVVAGPGTTPHTRVLQLLPGSPACRVVVVDDQPENCELVEQMLIPVGFEVGRCKDGAEAVARCAESLPQLVVMDLRMPVMDGYEATRRIRAAHGAAVKIIACSAGVFAENQQLALAEGADVFMSKPFREAELLERIKQLTGVDYIYEAAEGVDARGSGEPAAEASTPQEIQRLPGELLEALRQAARRAEYDEMLALVDQVAARDERLGQLLSQSVKCFDYGTLHSLLAPNEPHV